MSKVMLFSDTHLYPYKQFSTTLSDGLNSRSKIILNAINEVYKYAEDEQIEEVWFLGDLFHTRDRLHIREFNEVCKIITGFSGRTTLLAGNHDYPTASSLYSTYDSLSNNRLVTNTIEEIQLCGSPLKSIYVYFVPYSKVLDIKNIETHKDGVNILVTHADIEGAKVGSGEHKLKGGLGVKSFSQFDLVLNGHYHKRQKLGKNIHCIGSLVAHTFGDAGDARGCSILNLDDLSIEELGVTAPMFHVLKEDEIEESSARDIISINDYVRVDSPVPIDEERLKKQLNTENMVFNYEKNYTKVSRLQVDTDTSFEDMVKKYIDKEARDLDTEQLFEMVKEKIG